MGAAAKGSAPEFEAPNGSAFSDLENSHCSRISNRFKIVPELVCAGSGAAASSGIPTATLLTELLAEIGLD